MAIDYAEVMQIIGSETAAHPQTTSLAMQTYSLWNAHANEIKQIQTEWQQTEPKATGAFDTVGIALQIMALHPNAANLLIQTLTMWQTRIPDLIQIIGEIQAAATQAAKT
jgi:hypothetical protein